MFTSFTNKIFTSKACIPDSRNLRRRQAGRVKVEVPELVPSTAEEAAKRGAQRRH